MPGSRIPAPALLSLDIFDQGGRIDLFRNLLPAVHFVIMSHLQSGPLEATFDIEALVCLAAIQDRLIAAYLFGNMVECLDDPQPKFLALLVLCNSDVLNVTHKTHVVDKLALNNYGAGANDGLRGIEDNEDEVCGGNGGDEVVSLEEGVIARLADSGEDTQGVEEACMYM